MSLVCLEAMLLAATIKRSFLKTISFRVLATMITVALVYTFTHSLALAGTIGSIETGSKLVLYYFHERAWQTISWGA